jgi:hypothetical protein
MHFGIDRISQFSQQMIKIRKSSKEEKVMNKVQRKNDYQQHEKNMNKS